ncbi:uroporphyrinogen-III synthase [Celerinatantimonas sp. YJH-8]|uniref:uroporphyrinogen-III synthase n=1 Tax=Celerinatantimonas sp. YJH-8 TaxID=3228714 RepID=UPI0038C71B37
MRRSNRQLLLTGFPGSVEQDQSHLQTAGYCCTYTSLLDLVGCAPWQGKIMQDYLAGFDAIIAMSPRASQFCQPDQWPTKRYFAIGPSSGKRWISAGLDVQLATPSNSEGMLELLSQQPDLSSLQVLLLRGATSRNWLKQKLPGLVRHYSELCCYQQCPKFIQAEIVQQWAAKGINSVVCNSALQANHLIHLANRYHCQAWLQNCDLFIPSERVGKSLIDFKFRHVYNCQGATVEALMATLETIE